MKVRKLLVAAGFAVVAAGSTTAHAGLLFNGLCYNGLAFNGLLFNGLAFNGSQHGAAAPGTLTGLTTADGTAYEIVTAH